MRYIDNTNFTGGELLLENGSNILLENGSAIDMESGINPFGTPDPTAEFPQEIYFLDRKISENRDVVQWEAISALDLVNVKLPKRIATKELFPGIGAFQG